MEAHNSTSQVMPTWEVVVKVIPLSIIILLIVLGNLLVIVAVLTQRPLRTPPNVLISSLALADLTVGIFILPLNISDMILSKWIFSNALCRIWLTSDVTLCSTSILHISAIAVDRYRSINEGVSYVQQRTIKMSVAVCISLWVVALWIASAPILGWNDWDKRQQYECMLPQNLGYIIHSALGAFFLPMIVMVTVYIKIFATIRDRLRQRSQISCVETPSHELTEDSKPSTELSEERPKRQKKKHSEQITEILASKLRFSLTKERKAAQTLGILIGAFLICWAPFTLVYIASGICLLTDCHVPLTLFQTVTWLGYVNSALNPIIYTVYNQEFRRAFIRILHLNSASSCRKPNNISII